MKKIIFAIAIVAFGVFGFCRANNIINNNSNLNLEDVELSALAGCEVIIEGWGVLHCSGSDGSCFSYKTDSMSLNCIGKNQ